MSTVFWVFLEGREKSNYNKRYKCRREDFSMKDNNCAYCMGGELLDKFGIKICDLDVSQLILFKEQSKPGGVLWPIKTM